MRTQTELAGDVVRTRAREQTLRNRMHEMADLLELERVSISTTDCEKCQYLGEILKKATAACRSLAGERLNEQDGIESVGWEATSG